MAATRPTDDYRFVRHGMEQNLALSSGDALLPTYKGAYISITDRCNTDVCEYCYARDQQDAHAPMKLDDFRLALHWLSEISDFPEVYLVGGEPSSVPRITSFLDAIAEHGWGGTIYTNGAFGPNLCQRLSSHEGLARVAFHYERAFFDEFRGYRKRLLRNIAALSDTKQCSLLVVITGDSTDLADPMAIAEKYNLALTWIFATPSSGGTPYVNLQAMRRLGANIETFLLEASARGIETAPDLPVPLCVFDDDFLTTYGDTFALIRRCRPFVYFGTDLTVHFCTALPHYSADRPDDSAQLRAIILRHREVDRQLKLQATFAECVGCRHHESGECQGGCMTHKIYATESKVELVGELALDHVRPVAPVDEVKP